MGNDQCVAAADAGAAGVHVTIRRNEPVQLTVSLAAQPAPSTPVTLRFSGPAGNWQVLAHRSSSHAVGVALGSDNTALSRVLVLLSGGTLDVGVPDQPLASLAIAASDTRGQLWFDCAREKMF
jgi:hypothetical protein